MDITFIMLSGVVAIAIGLFLVFFLIAGIIGCIVFGKQLQDICKGMIFKILS